MEWICESRGCLRGNIESVCRFIDRNIQWWKENENAERVRRREYYDKFLENIKLPDTTNKIVAELGPGPFGGILQVCNLPAKRKVFIDYILRELVKLNFIRWPEDALYVDAPAEAIPMKFSSVDVLISYNTLDHGWDPLAGLFECVRISKRCYVSFDCRGDSKHEVKIREDKRDKDHFHLLRFNQVWDFLEREVTPLGKWTMVDMKTKAFPVVCIQVEKYDANEPSGEV